MKHHKAPQTWEVRQWAGLDPTAWRRAYTWASHVWCVTHGAPGMRWRDVMVYAQGFEEALYYKECGFDPSRSFKCE